MSYLTQNAVIGPEARVRVLETDLAAGAKALLMLAGAGWLGHRWWTGAALVPMSWEPPSAGAVFLIPAVAVVGLLALRLVVGGREGGDAAQHLMAMAARWAGVCAGFTAVWLLLTTIDLYGGVARLVEADNLTSVLSADRAASSQLILLEVAVLVALFGPRLGGWRESGGLLALSSLALLSAVPFAPAGSSHGADPSPLLPAVVGLQALGLAVWLGVLLSLPHLLPATAQLRRHLLRCGDLVSTAALVVATTAVLAGLLYPGLPTPPVLAVAEVAAVTLVIVVGYRHRHRMMDVVCVRRGLAFGALALGEVVVMTAVVLLACWLPTGG